MEADYPSPTSEARDHHGSSSAESIQVPCPAAKREEHFESVAVGATGFVRGDTVQNSLDQLPDSVLPQIARLLHRD